MRKTIFAALLAAFCAFAPAAAFAAQDASAQGGMALTNEAAESVTLDVTYPYADTDADGANDFILEVGQQNAYFSYGYFAPKSVGNPTDGTVTASFSVEKGTDCFYRVTNPKDSDAVTYGNYASATKDTAVTVTASDMHIGDTAFDAATVVRDFSRNTYDTGDIYLNVGPTGCIDMDAGQTFSLYPMRNWLPIESTNNTRILQPDFHVEAIDLEGTDVVTVSERTAADAGKHKWTITGAHKGTAMVKVTYDALVHGDGMKKYTDFSAIWPENTGLLVVSVDRDSAVQASFTLNGQRNAALAEEYESTKAETDVYGSAAKLAGDALDAEFDVLYYADDAGARYTFSVEPGATVSVARGTVQDGALNLGAFTQEGVEVAADGTATVSGLTTGKHVIKVAKGDNVIYQVVRARHVDYKLYAGTDTSDEGMLICDSASGIVHAYTDGETPITRAAYEALSGDEQAAYAPLVEPGSTATIVFDRLYHPASKLSGRYNMTAYFALQGADGTMFKQDVPAVAYGGPGQYTFPVAASCQRLQFTLPASLMDGAYEMDGALLSRGFGYGSYGSHREVTYEAGVMNSGLAPLYGAYFGQLPLVTVDVVGEKGDGPEPSEDEQAKAQQAADDFAALVAAIGNVNLDAADRISAARSAYDALSDAARALVGADTLAQLEQAEAQLAALQLKRFKPATIEEGCVRVVIENTTWSVADGAPWAGVLVDEQVAIDSLTDNMRNLVDCACTQAGIGEPAGNQNYVMAIEGLGDPDSGAACFGEGGGWMVTLNGWFINKGMNEFEGRNEAVREGDEIRLVYTCDGGSDVGSSNNISYKKLKALAVGAGELSPAFSAETNDYVLTVPKGTTRVYLQPIAQNRNFQARTYVGEADPLEAGYRPNDGIPVEDGTVVTVLVGDSFWPSMSTSEFDAQEYRITVHIADDPSVQASYSPVKTGSMAEIVASVNAPYASIAWQSSRDDGTSWTDVAGQDGLTLTVPASAETVGTQYRAIASLAEDFGTTIVSNVVTLTVVEEDPGTGGGETPVDPKPADPTPSDAEKQAAADKKAAATATSAIAKLPAASNVTDANAKAVAAARAQYNKLTAAQKKLVPAATLKKLKAAETAVKTTITLNTSKVTKTSIAKALKKAGKKASAIKKVVLGTKVKRIGKQAFAKLKKAKTLVVKTKKLKKSYVKGALSKSKVTTVKVPKAKLKAYKKMFTKKVCGKKVTVKK